MELIHPETRGGNETWGLGVAHGSGRVWAFQQGPFSKQDEIGLGHQAGGPYGWLSLPIQCITINYILYKYIKYVYI